MEKYRDLEGKSIAGLTQKIKRAYGEEGVFSFFIEKYNIDFEKIVQRYQDGEGLRALAEEHGASLGIFKRLFTIKGIPLRTQAERMALLNKRMPQIMMTKYGVENAYQMKSIIEKIQTKRAEKKDEIYQKVKNTCLERYGVENVFQREDIKQDIFEKLAPRRKEIAARTAAKITDEEKKQKLEKTCKTMLERYGVENAFQLRKVVDKNHSKEIKEKQLKTKIDHGYAIDYSKYNSYDKEKFDHDVLYYTDLAYREFKHIIDPDEKWHSKSESRAAAPSIDHIFSRKDGFENQISPLIISHPCNLRLISQSENSIKNFRSDQTIEELLASIKVFNENHINEHSEFLELFNSRIILKEDNYGKAYFEEKDPEHFSEV